MQYFVFALWNYDAEGGAQDCVGVVDTPENAMALGDQHINPNGSKDWAHIAIVDSGQLKIIAISSDPGNWTAPHPNKHMPPMWP